MKSANQPEKAGPFGHILRFVLGGLLLITVFRYYFVVPRLMLIATLGLVIGLAAFYTLLDLAIADLLPNVNPLLGAILANALVLGMWIFGRNAWQLGAATYIGISLIVTALRADSGCELMSIPGLILHRHAHLGCFFFSPVDWIERAVAGRRLHG
jgi:hypothetical protein